MRINSKKEQVVFQKTCRVYLNIFVFLLLFFSVFASVLNATGHGSAHQSPVANFIYTPTDPEINENVIFDASLSYDPNGNDLTYLWEFENNGGHDNDNSQIITYSWSEPGTYLVTLTVTNTLDLYDECNKYVIVTEASSNGGSDNNPPNTPDTPTGEESLIVEQIGVYETITTDPDEDQIQYRFHIGTLNGPPFDTDWSDLMPSGSSYSIEYTFTVAGTYFIKAKAKDENGEESDWSDELTVIVSESDESENQPPVADAGGPYEVQLGENIVLDGSNSYDSDGAEIQRYDWDLDYDGEFDDATGATITFSSSSEGIITILLRVTDIEGLTGTDDTYIIISSNAVDPDADPTSDNPADDGTEIDEPIPNNEGTGDADGSIDLLGNTDDNSGQAAEWDEIASGIENVFILNSADSSDITRVTFVTNNNLKNARLVIKNLNSKPEEIAEKPTYNGFVIKYLDIKLTSDEIYVTEDELESMSFRFRIKKSKIIQNNIDRNTIKMMRYHNGEWQELITRFDGEDEIYVYYEADTPGLSTFAVVGNKVIEKEQAYTPEKPLIPTPILYAIVIFGIIVLISVLIKSRYIYVDKDYKKEKNNKKEKISTESKLMLIDE